MDLVDRLMDVARNPAAANDQPVMFLVSVNQAAYTYTPMLTSHTFDNLRSTGDLRLIREETVTRAMFDYYGFDLSQHQFRPIQIETEVHHFELAAGVLSEDQEVFIQDNWRVLPSSTIESAKAGQFGEADMSAAANRLRETPQLIAWLP